MRKHGELSTHTELTENSITTKTGNRGALGRLRSNRNSYTDPAITVVHCYPNGSHSLSAWSCDFPGQWDAANVK